MKSSIHLLAVCALIICSLTVYGTDAAAETVVKKALASAESQHPTNAIPLLEDAAKQYPFHSANFEVLFQLGYAYVQEDRIGDACRTFDILLKRYGKYADTMPRVDETMIFKAQIIAATNSVDAGIQSLKTFMKQRPKSSSRPEAMYQLAELYIQKGNYETGKKYLTALSSADNPRKEDAEKLLTELAKREKKPAAESKSPATVSPPGKQSNPT